MNILDPQRAINDKASDKHQLIVDSTHTFFSNSLSRNKNSVDNDLAFKSEFAK